MNKNKMAIICLAMITVAHVASNASWLGAPLTQNGYDPALMKNPKAMEAHAKNFLGSCGLTDYQKINDGSPESSFTRCYYGETRGGRQNGVGICYNLARSNLSILPNFIFAGDWKEGEPCGLGMMIVCGTGPLKDKIAAIYDGIWRHGSSGKGTIFSTSDQTTYEGSWKGLQRNGKGASIDHRGIVYWGEHSAGLRHGSGVMELTRGGTILSGKWIKNVFQQYSTDDERKEAEEKVRKVWTEIHVTNRLVDDARKKSDLAIAERKKKARGQQTHHDTALSLSPITLTHNPDYTTPALGYTVISVALTPQLRASLTSLAANTLPERAGDAQIIETTIHQDLSGFLCNKVPVGIRIDAQTIQLVGQFTETSLLRLYDFISKVQEH